MSEFSMPLLRPLHRARLAGVLMCGLFLSACATGPDFVTPTPAVPDDWTSWRSADDALHAHVATSHELPATWWLAFGDPVLDGLQQRAIEGSPDLRTAALRLAQARAQRKLVAAQRGPDIKASGGVQHQRQSEYAAGTRLVDTIAADRAPLVSALSEPFTLYQAGFDASWELDLWGRIRRSVEAADAEVAGQAALLDLARLSLRSEVARTYFELRSTQRQLSLVREEVAVLEHRIGLLKARAQGGAADHLDLERQLAEAAAARAQVPCLLAAEGAVANQLALLLGERPGALREELAAPAGVRQLDLPALALGLPSEVALRRPDIRAAQARLHRAVASVGVARAELYPSVRLGARFGFESFDRGEFAEWGSRTWSLGPSLMLPLFDHGRRKGTVHLRELEQQEAAVNYQRTVLKAWHEIDDALSAYTAEHQQLRELTSRVQSTEQAYTLARARHDGGLTDFIAVLDSQRSHLQARQALALSQERLGVRYIAINKAVGNAGP